jgi:membrane protein
MTKTEHPRYYKIVQDIVNRLNEFFVRELWDVDINSLGRFKAFIIKALRLLYVTIREFSEGQLTLRAMGLVYTTLLSLIPVLAISFSVLKAFGVHNEVAPFLSNLLAPFGPAKEEMTQKIIEFIENTKVGVLGTIGLALLIYTVISLIQKIEDALNYIWKVNTPRSFARRFSDYMSVILIAPVLIFTAISLTAYVMNTDVMQKLISIQPFGMTVYFAGKLVPYIFVCAAFTFIYMFIPNTKVKFTSALVGGIFAGVLWETIGWGFASFIASSKKYSAIYSGFAIVILFMIWLYYSWLIILVGAQVSFYYQHPQFLTVKKEVVLLSNRLKERLALLIMFLIGYNYYHNKPPWIFNSLVERLGVSLSVEPIERILNALERKGFILETGDEPPRYIPARDIETIKLKELIRSVRTDEEEVYSIEERFLSMCEVDDVIKRTSDAAEGALGEETIKDLVLSCREET